MDDAHEVLPLELVRPEVGMYFYALGESMAAHATANGQHQTGTILLSVSEYCDALQSTLFRLPCNHFSIVLAHPNDSQFNLNSPFLTNHELS